MGLPAAADLPWPTISGGWIGQVQWTEGFKFSAFLQSSHARVEPAFSGENDSACLDGTVVLGNIALRRNFIGGGDFSGR